MLLLDQNPTIQSRLGLSPQEVVKFCQRRGITKMTLFGSILRDDFRADGDIDWLITFAPKDWIRQREVLSIVRTIYGQR